MRGEFGRDFDRRDELEPRVVGNGARQRGAAGEVFNGLQGRVLFPVAPDVERTHRGGHLQHFVARDEFDFRVPLKLAQEPPTIQVDDWAMQP